MLIQQIVQTVARDLPREAAEFGVDEVGMGIDKLMQLLIDVLVANTMGIEGNLFSVGQHDGD